MGERIEWEEYESPTHPKGWHAFPDSGRERCECGKPAPPPGSPPKAAVMARTQQCKVRYWIGQLDPERRETHQESFQCIKDRGHVGQGDDEHLFFTPLGGVRWPACGRRTVSPTGGGERDG